MSRFNARSMRTPVVADSISIRPNSPIDPRYSPPRLTTKDAPSPNWTRPTDWLPLTPNAATEVCFLYAVYQSGSNYIALEASTSSGNFVVDWGDGTSNSYGSGVTVEKELAWADYGDLTARGYRQALIRITGNITAINFDKRHSDQSQTTASSTQIVECKAQGPSIVQITFYNGIGHLINSRSLENFEFIGTCGLTDLSHMFMNCSSLQQVSLPPTPSATTAQYMFKGCKRLRIIELLDTSACLNMSEMFTNCDSLLSAHIPDIHNATTTMEMFSFCYSLVDVRIGDPLSATTCQNMFKSCYSITSIGPLRTPSATNLTSMFTNCVSLREIVLPDTAAVTNFQDLCYSCYSLTRAVVPKTSAGINLDNMFAYCEPLTEIVIGELTSATSMAYMFSGHLLLQEIELPPTPNLTDASGLFSGCCNLQSVRFTDTSSLQNTADTFLGCNSLRSVTFPSTDQLSNISNMFTMCHSLTEVPTLNTASVTNMANAFAYSGIKRLQNLNVTSATTLFNLCKGCKSLEAVSLIDNGNNAKSFQEIFSECENLKTVTGIKAQIGDSFTAAFGFCGSLKSIGSTGIRTTHDLSFCNLSSTELNNHYTNLGTVSDKSITVTGNPGTSSDNPSIATAKGWTVIG